ncbi:hypothetical protein QBC34DRAFT_477818 [Podospora aff. communis PSN243]|uniref:Uncharacterized protein n=1 Tax=Podospora aff. communis PSN243 TaxID=3040156 RepID=A0AAV9G5F9_9PEZI|nr:hypothetical protein QBC34DRAFT_477818 [Podospora aff. communis PSN243]
MATAPYFHPNAGQPVAPDPFAHIRHFPMFPLLTAEDQAAVVKMQAQAVEMAGQVQPVPNLNVAEKVVLHASGMEIMNVRRMENAAIKTGASLTALNASNIHTAVSTRWGAVVDGRTVVVDVYETRVPFSNPWLLRSNADVRLNVAGKREVKAKAQKTSSKTWTKTPVDSIVLLTGDRNVEMTMVQREERGISPAEAPTVQKRFKNWTVPQI